MKKIIYIVLAAVVLSTNTSCIDDLLNQEPTDQISTGGFWKTTADAAAGLSGVYDGMKETFRRHYRLECHPHADLLNGWGLNTWEVKGFMWDAPLLGINRANNVITNIRLMQERTEASDTKTIELLIRYEAEARFLRGLHYALMIDLYGDFPYMDRVLSQQEAYEVIRTPIATVRDAIIEDYDFAIANLPVSYTGSEVGRVTRGAAYAYKAKLCLYWASWKKFGRPEITGFNKDEREALDYYGKAIENFEKVMGPEFNYDLFMDAEPGEYENPNYYQLFDLPNEKCEEIIFSIQFAGPNIKQGEDYAFRFGNRNAINGWCSISALSNLVDLYQLQSTGEYAPKLILSPDVNLEGGSSNVATYEGRDFRMRATILWDGQKMRRIATDGKTMGEDITFLYGNRDGVNYINYEANRSGYIMRKYVRQYAGYDREDGPQDCYMMRYADVLLMYCEAKNEVNGGPTADMFHHINRIRKRGNLPGLNKDKFSTKDAFFEAIQQERAVEFIGEGHRYFDIRRWRIAEKIWNYPNGITVNDSRGAFYQDQYKNANDKTFPRYYINQIPESERIQNPNLTQNEPWL